MKLSDPNFTEKTGAEFGCVLLIAKHEICKVVHHIKSKTIVEYHRETSEADLFVFAEELSHLLQHKIDKLNLSYKSKVVAFDTASQTLVPVSLFDTERKNDYLELNTGTINDFIIESEEIAGENFVLCSAIPREISNIINDYFAPDSAFPCYASLLKWVLKQNSISPFDLYVNFSHKQLDLAVCKKSKLLLCNSFDFEQKEDVLYHLLNVCEQLEIPAEQVVLTCIGSLRKNDPIHGLLYDYFKTVRFAKNDHGVVASSSFSTLEDHYTTLLF